MGVEKQKTESGFCLEVLGNLPGDREELSYPGSGMGIDPGEDVLEIGVWIDGVHLARAYEGVEDGSGLAAFAAADEEEVLSSDDQGTYCVLDEIVVRPETKVVDVFPEDGLLVPGVGEGFPERGLWQSHSRIDELEESVYDADSALAPEHEGLRVGKPSMLRRKQGGDAMLDPVEDGDESDEGLGFLDANVEGVDHASPQMSPAADAEDSFASEDGVEARGCVGLDVASEVLQNPSGPLLRLFVGEVEEDHRRSAAGPIGPHSASDSLGCPSFEHGLRRLVDIDVGNAKDDLAELVVERVRRLGAACHPVGKRAAGDLDALAFEDVRLAVERQAVPMFRDDEMGKEADVGLATIEGAFLERGHHYADAAASPPVGTDILRADVANGVEAAGLEGERLCDVLAHAKHRQPSSRTDLLGVREVDDLFDALQVRRDLHPAIEMGSVGGLLPLVGDLLRLRLEHRAFAIERVAFIQEEVEGLLVGVDLVGASSEHPAAHLLDQLHRQRELLLERFNLFFQNSARLATHVCGLYGMPSEKAIDTTTKSSINST